MPQIYLGKRYQHRIHSFVFSTPLTSKWFQYLARSEVNIFRSARDFKATSGSLSSEYGKHKTVMARLWHWWFQIKVLETFGVFAYSLESELWAGRGLGFLLAEISERTRERMPALSSNTSERLCTGVPHSQEISSN